MSKPITENIIEESAIEILQSQGWEYANGKEISPEGLFCERENFQQIVLIDRLRKSIAKINLHIPVDAQEAAVTKVAFFKTETTEKLMQEIVSFILELTIKYRGESAHKILLNSKTETLCKSLKSNADCA